MFVRCQGNGYDGLGNSVHLPIDNYTIFVPQFDK